MSNIRAGVRNFNLVQYDFSIFSLYCGRAAFGAGKHVY